MMTAAYSCKSFSSNLYVVTHWNLQKEKKIVAVIVDGFSHILPRPFAENFVKKHPTEELRELASFGYFGEIDSRLRLLDKYRIHMQVLSLTNPNVQLFEEKEGASWARRVNEELAEVVGRYPGRFIGLATVAPQNPEEAAREIERAVRELGMKGVVVQSHARNEYLDAKKFWPVFEKCEEMDVPIYLHPIVPSESILGPYAEYGYPLAGPILGFAADVALHVMRLIYGGLFNRYPNLRIILAQVCQNFIFLKKNR